MSKRLYVYILAMISAAMLVVALWHTALAERVLPQLAAPASPARSAFGASIAASGVIESESENIAVGTALSGVVLEVYVPASRVGDRVQEGDPLFRVDDRRLKAQLAAREAKLATAKVQVKRLEALPRLETLPPSEARVRTAQATAALAEDEFKRAQQLFKRNVTTEQELVTKRLANDAAMHHAAEAEADHALLQLGAWEPDLDVAQAAVNQTQADVDLATTELDRAIVRAPVDGQVLQVNVHVGEYVGAQVGAGLVVIGNVQPLHLRADIDENDIPRFNSAAPAVAYVRGAPQHRFPLKFVRIEPYVTAKKSLTGDNTERIDTRVLQIIYAVDAPDARLFVGQQMDIFIDAKPN